MKEITIVLDVPDCEHDGVGFAPADAELKIMAWGEYGDTSSVSLLQIAKDEANSPEDIEIIADWFDHIAKDLRKEMQPLKEK